MPFRVVHYINQFFAGIGGEEKADMPPEVRKGPMGPGLAFSTGFGDEAEIVATVICGDNYFASNIEKASAEIVELISPYTPDAVIAGPAFNAGRYGTACGGVCDGVTKKLGIPTVTGMFRDNPGVELYRKSTYIVETTDSTRGMREAAEKMSRLLLKLLKKIPLGKPIEEGYLERGIRVNCFGEKVGAERASEMLVKKLLGQPFETEYPMPVFDRVPPAPPIKDLSTAVIALVTSGGIVPKNNPDHIEASSASHFGEYSIEALSEASAEHFQTAHGGYDPTYVNEDPNRVLPVDVLRDLEREKVFRKLHDRYYATVGNGTSIANAKKFGAEIATRLKQDGVDAVILTST